MRYFAVKIRHLHTLFKILVKVRQYDITNSNLDKKYKIEFNSSTEDYKVLYFASIIIVILLKIFHF